MNEADKKLKIGEEFVGEHFLQVELNEGLTGKVLAVAEQPLSRTQPPPSQR